MNGGAARPPQYAPRVRLPAAGVLPATRRGCLVLVGPVGIDVAGLLGVLASKAPLAIGRLRALLGSCGLALGDCRLLLGLGTRAHGPRLLLVGLRSLAVGLQAAVARLTTQLPRVGTPGLEPPPARHESDQRDQDHGDDYDCDDGFSAHRVLLLEIVRTRPVPGSAAI